MTEQPNRNVPAGRDRVGLPRLTVVTNGNFFSNIGLSPLLAGHDRDWRLQVFITNGLRKQTGQRWREAWCLLKRWGLRYFCYKVFTLVVPAIASRLLKRPLDVPSQCRNLAVPYTIARNVNDNAVRESVRGFDPDLLLSFSCPYRIKQELLAISRIGCLNVHSSLLPAYAGVCTYVHVLANREAVTGVTVHEMVDRFDAGRIVAQAPIPIPRRISLFRLFSQQCVLAGQLLPVAIRQCIDAGAIVGRQQDMNSRSYYSEPTAADIQRLRTNGFCLFSRTDWARLLAPELGCKART